MITDSFDTSEPILKLEQFYGPAKHIIDKCIILFSDEIFNYLKSLYNLEEIGQIKGSSFDTPVYAFQYKEEKIGVYLSPMGSVLAATNMVECSHITGAKKFVMYGSCGTLDNEVTKGSFVVPTEAYRDEGISYHYMAPSDFITIKNADKVAEIFEKFGIPFIKGKTWTTDAILMETVNKVKKRRDEGCVVVEMELSACQALANYYGLELYDFLQPGDILIPESPENYDKTLLHAANHSLIKLNIGLKLIEEI